MEKVLKLYKYIDGVNDTPFPNEEQQVITSDFRYDVKRMGGAPIITCTILHVLCLDKLWDESVYAYFNGERFFIKQVPTSSYAHTDSRYKHELELVSERVVLDNVYVYDVVDNSAFNDKPVSNNSKFAFFGTIHEFAERLNQSLQYSKLEYRVVVDDGISSEAMMVSFQDQFFSNAIQESYNTYNVPYYFEGKTIHFGYTNNAITRTFRYGKDESLLSIQKQNANYKIVNRVTGIGSADNIPYYYPNDYESKEEVEANGGTWVNPQPNLMPSIYRESLGNDRFYEALNNKYKIPDSNEYYEFANPYTDGNPKEHIVNFDNIKPTIKGVENASGYRIDMFSEFAYDANDNDEVDKDGNYLHPYFFAKLRKFDGEHGFNLFDHAIDEQEMTIAMTSGSCGSCEFVIGVDESTQKNTVQVDSNGYLERDDEGNVKFGAPQDEQNDTINNEVWIALRKDVDTFGVIMPNATNNYKPSINDTFVILHIDLPKAYIIAAEDRLKAQLIEYMSLNNSEKFNFSISFSRIFFAEYPDILAQLNENARIQIEYDNTDYELYISSYSYSMSSDKPLPEIRVELSDTLTISQNALQTAISEIKSEIISSGGSGNVRPNDILKLGLKYFLRKDTDDRSNGKVASDKGFEVGKFVAGASGAIIQVDAKNGQTIAELDKLYVRMKAYFETLEIINVNSVGGKMILSPAGSVTCLGVEELEDSYRCYFLGEQDGEIIENRWKAGMQAYSQMFNAKEGVSNKVSNNYYWRLVTAVSEDVVDFNNQKCHYIDLSKSDCDTNSDIPKVGDVINHRGCRNNVDYMNFIEFSAVGTNAPYITLFQGVNSYSLADKEYVSFGYDQSTGRAYMNVYGDMYFGNRDGSSYIKYNPTDGLEVKGKLSVGTTYNGSEIGSLFDKQQEDLEKFTEAVTKEFENIRNEMDGAIDTWFGEETPTLGNYPAVDWATNADKDSHLGDLFYTNDGKAYRFQYTEANGYHWAAIEDSEVVKALELAQKALDTADGKRRVFIEQPYTPYDLGDLWAAGESQPLMRCVNARESGSYYASDWAVADDSHAYTDAVKKDLQASINATKSELDKAIEDAEAAAKDYTDEGKAVLQLAIDEMEKSKANLDDVYTKAFEDDTITKLEARALEAAQAEAKAAQALAEEASAIYADGVVTKEEEARIEQAKVNLAEAKAYAEEKANEAFNNAMEQIAGYEYLKEALKEDTSIEGGLIQSSLIKLGYTGASGYVVMAGSNGTLDSSLGDKSIAFWAGGDMLDRENGSNVSNAADFLVRMDGSGYAAGGNLSWDINGKITADPMSFFVGEDTVSALLRAFTITYNSSNAPTLITPNAPFGVFNVNGAATFASTLSVNGDITAKSRLLLGDIPMYKSKDGVVYIDGNLVVKGGITMYGVDSTDIPSLINSLPVATTKEKGVAYFDPNFFSVSSDGKVSFIGETGGGLDIVSLQNYLTQNSYLNVTEGDNRYLKLSGGTITDDLNFGAGKSIKSANNIVLQMYSGVDTYLRGSSNIYLSTPSLRYLDANGNAYTIIHLGNIGDYALKTNGSNKMSASAYINWGTAEGNEDYSANGNGIRLLGYNANTDNYRGGIHVGTRYGWQLVRDGYKNMMQVRFRKVDTTTWDVWKNIAFTDSNVASATKLQNERTIWGRGFDGTGDVSGNLEMGISKVYWNDDASNYFITVNGAGMMYHTSYYGIFFRTGGSDRLAIDSTGNVGIGTTSPSSTLSVSGGVTLDGYFTSGSVTKVKDLGSKALVISTNYARTNWGMNLWIEGNGNGYIQQQAFVDSGTTYPLVLQPFGGNVGIGIKYPSAKLHVSGDILATGGITTNDSVTINGIKLSKSKDGVLYLDGNLVVKGGVTMYGTDATASPSILDSLPIASTTKKGIAYFDPAFFSVGSDGKVSFIGKTDGFNATELQNYLTQNSYLNTTSGDNRYLKLSGGELTGLLTISRSAVGIILDRTVSGNPHITYKCLGTAVGDIGVSVDGNPVFYSYNTSKWNNIWHEGNFNPSNYLPLSGGTMNASAYISWSASIEGAEDYSAYGLGIKLLGYNANTSSYRGGIHVGTRYGWQLTRNGFSNTLECRMRNVDTNTFGYWKIIAFTDSNVASATKLQNERTIWGRGFDGTGDVSGILTLPLDNQLQWADSGGAMIYGTSSKRIIIDGNVGIGTNTPTDKLHVHGTLRLAENVPHTLRYHATGTYDAGLVVGTAGNECMSFVANNAVTSFMFVQGGTALKSWGSGTWTSQTPALQIKNNSVYVNSLIADGVTPTYRFLVNGTARIDRLDFSHSNEINAFYAEGEINPANLHLNYRSSGDVTLACGGGNVGIGTTTPSHKLHVVGNTYLNGDVFADELNTFDVLPRTSATYDLGNSSYKWNNVYASSMIAGYIHGGGSALYLGNSDNSSYIYIREDMKASSESWSLTTSGTMSLSGDLTSGSYGSNCVAKFQGIGSGNGYHSVVELITNNEVSISYSNNSRYSDSRRWSVGRASSNSNYRFNFWNASYNGVVSYIDLNGNFWVAGGITMYSDRRKKTILRDVELSLKEVANAPLIEHYYNSDDKKTIHVGSIAQYWAGLNDWFCKLDNEGYYTMEVQNAALASAISVARELDRYETKTDKQIKKLKKRICELEEEVERLKSA